MKFKTTMKVGTSVIIVALAHSCCVQNNDTLYVTAAFSSSATTRVHGISPVSTRSGHIHHRNRFISNTRLFSLSNSKNGVSTTKKKLKRARRKGDLDRYNAPADHNQNHKHDSPDNTIDEMFFDESTPESIARKKREASMSAHKMQVSRNSTNRDASSDARQQHMEYMKKLDGRPALVLNADYQPLSHIPLSLWSWQDAVKAVFAGRVTVVDVYPGVSIQSIHIEIPLPSVIALNEYVPEASQSKPPFSRKNVFLRDGYRCQYCAKRFRNADLSLDHYVPRCKGGTLTWYVA